MKHFQAGIRTSSGTINEAACEIIAGDIGFHLVGLFGVSLAAATASTFGIGRPAALGITPTSPVAFKQTEGNALSQAKSALAWGTSPTVPAQFFYRVTLPATIGAYRDLPLPKSGIWVPALASIVVWNIAANGVSDLFFTIWE